MAAAPTMPKTSDFVRGRFDEVRGLSSHGVGRTIHEEPRVPNEYDPWQADVLTELLSQAIPPVTDPTPLRITRLPSAAAPAASFQCEGLIDQTVRAERQSESASARLETLIPGRLVDTWRTSDERGRGASL